MKRIYKGIFIVCLIIVMLCALFMTASAFSFNTQDESNDSLDIIGSQNTIVQTSEYDIDTPVIFNIVSNGRTIEINWNAVEGANRYRVFYKYGSSWKGIGYTKDNSFSYTPTLNKSYTYTVRCVDEENNYVSAYDKNGYTYTTLLDMPNLQNADIVNGDVEITWDAVNGADYYRVFYWDTTNWKKIADTKSTSYIFKEAAYNKEYKFTVRCVDKAGNFESPYDKNGIVCSTKIDTPIIKNITSSGKNVVISWDKVDKAGKYRVFKKTSTSWKMIGDTSNLSYTVTDAPFSVEQTYTVRCISSKGCFVSDYDKRGFSFTLNLDTPVLKSVVTNTGSTATITWDRVNGATYYRVFYKREGWDTWKKIKDIMNTSYTDSNMKQDITYIYTVRCIDSKGNFISSYDKKGISHKIKIDSLPAVYSVSGATKGSVNISYYGVTGVSYYELLYKGGSKKDWTSIVKTKSSTYKWNYVETNEILYYAIRCLAPNGDVISDYDTNGYLYKYNSPYCQTPKINDINYLSSTGKITIKWNKVSGADAYLVRSSIDGNTWSDIATTTSNEYSFVSAPNTKELYSVVCLDKTGNIISEFDSKKIMKIDFPAPVLQKSSSVIKFAWNKIPNAKGYEIYRQYYKTNGFVYYKTIGNVETFSDTDLEPGRGYFYKVKAIFDEDISCTSGILRAVAGMCAPVTYIDSHVSRINLTWNRSSYAEGYNIYISEDGKKFSFYDKTTKLFYNTPRLTGGRKYYFRVEPYKYVGKELVYGTFYPVNYTCTSGAFGSSVGSTYVEVSLDQQYMWLYVNGSLKVETPVVTGNYGTNDTPSGFHRMWQIERNATLVGPTWSTPVDYWMAFTYDGCGIHDATWRDAFGGEIYKGDGSHGCVNTPYSAVAKVYSYSYIGMPVIIY